MSPVGPPTNHVARSKQPRSSNSPSPKRLLSPSKLVAFSLPLLVLAATLAITLLGGSTARAETVTYLPAGASCSNSAETNDDPAPCTASASTLQPGGGVAIVETDNAGGGVGDDDIQIVFDLGALDPSRITGANLQIGSSQSGDDGTIQLGGPAISSTNYGSVPDSGGATSTAALVSAVTSAAGGSLTVWLQVACSGSSNDCGAAVDSVALNVDLKDLTPSVALLVSNSSNRSNAQPLQGAQLQDTAYIFLAPGNDISQVRFFLDDLDRNSADRTENFGPFDFGGTNGNGTAAPWDPNSAIDGSHTIAAEVDFTNGSSIVVSAGFQTGVAPAPTPTPSPTPAPAAQDVYFSLASNRSNPALLDGQDLDSNIYVHILSGDDVTQARFWIDDRNRNGAANRVENLIPFDLAGGSLSQAAPLDAAALGAGTHWITVELDISGLGTQLVEGSFNVPTSGSGGGGSLPIPPGATRINPGQSIQSFVNANPAGTDFDLSAGVYRMQSVVPKDGNGFYGDPGATLNGSRILTNWISAGGGDYYAPNQTQQVDPWGGCAFLADGSRDNRCQYSEQVFVNGVSMRQVFSRSALNSTNFYFDYGADRIYIGQSPSGKFIEASVTERAFSGGGGNVVIANLLIEKYSTRAQTGAIHSTGGWTIAANEVRFIHGTGIRSTSGDRVLDNYVHHNGQLGIGGVGTNILVEGNEVSTNNTAGFLWKWEGGGIKFSVSNDLVFRDNYVHDNVGRGIWTDLDVVNTLTEGNRVESNVHEGIAHEVSYSAVIRNNVVRFNGTGEDIQLWGSQILIQNSSNVEVYGNEVWVGTGRGDGIGIVEQNRGSGRYGPHVSQNNYVHHNEIHLLRTGDNGLAGGCNGTNLFDFNTYYARASYFTTEARFEHCGPKRTWSQFRALGQEPNGVAIVTN